MTANLDLFLLWHLQRRVFVMSVEQVTERIRAEFDEMPGLALTVPQASRFFGLNHEMTQSAMDRLVGASFLRKTRDGSLVRSTR